MNVQSALQEIHEKKFKRVYLVLGTESYLQEQVRSAFMSSLHVDTDDLNFAHFDLEDESVDELLDEAESMPFFGDYRLVFGEHPFFLTAEKKSSAPEHNIERLLAYLQDPAETTILVFFADYEKLDERKKVTKFLKKYSELIDTQPMSEAQVRRFLQQTIENDGIKMDRKAFELFVRLTNMNLSKAMNEWRKLSLFASESKHLTLIDVQNLIPKSLEDNIFDLTNDVLNGKTTEALQLYQDLHTQGEETIKINAILISQIRLYLQTALLIRLGYQQGKIAQTLKVHPYRVKLAMQEVRKINMETLVSLYDELIENDYRIKTGQMDKEFLFELFLLKRA